MDDLNGLDEYCLTSQQQAILTARRSGMTWAEIQRKFDIDPANGRHMIRKIKARAAKAGWSPSHDMTRTVPDGFNVRGVSTMYDQDGNVRAQWVKSQANGATPEQLAEFMRESVESYKGTAKRVKAPRNTQKDILVVYPMGDPHIGMYSWADETGEDFDLDIAERNLTQAVARLVDVAPKSHTAVILNLGDFFHADNQQNTTMRSGHALDVDTRWGKVFQVGLRAMIQCIDEARRKHSRVIVKNLIGNHDDHTSQALAYALDAFFHKDSRVTVDISPAKFWYHQFHNVLIGAGHGDTAKPDLLPNIMAADVPELWGSTKFRYWYTGHIHSQNQKEYAGVIWESFKTLAGKDAWHSAKGYRSGRDMFCICHHKDHGEIERHRVDVGMLQK